MRHQAKRRVSLTNASIPFWSLLVAIALLSTPQARGETDAMSADDEAQWHAETVFQIAARTDYSSTQDRLRRRHAIVGTTQLRFTSPARPIVAGLMIEYQWVDEHADALLVAGLLTYKMPKWTAAAGPYYKKAAQHAAGDWHYWGSVRRRIANRQSLGVEIFGALETGRPAKWLVGYYGTITETLSVSVAAGTEFDAGPDWVARTSVMWRPRLARR
jgi:hypothetical protein